MSYEIPRFMSKLERELAGPSSDEAKRFRLLGMQKRQKSELEDTGSLEKAYDVISAVAAGDDEVVVHVVDNNVILSVTDFLKEDGLTRVSIGGMPIADKDGVHVGLEEAIKLTRPYVDPNNPEEYVDVHVWVPIVKPSITGETEINGNFGIDDMMCFNGLVSRLNTAIERGLLDGMGPDYTTIGGALDKPFVLPDSIRDV